MISLVLLDGGRCDDSLTWWHFAVVWVVNRLHLLHLLLGRSERRLRDALLGGGAWLAVCEDLLRVDLLGNLLCIHVVVLLVIESVAASCGCCISLSGVLRARHVHHGVRPLAGLGLRLLYVGRPWLRRLLLLL